MPVLPLVASISVSPGLIVAAPLRAHDHRQRRPVLDRARGIVALELGEEDVGGRARNALQAHERRVADEVTRGVAGHRSRNEKPRARRGFVERWESYFFFSSSFLASVLFLLATFLASALSLAGLLLGVRFFLVGLLLRVAPSPCRLSSWRRPSPCQPVSWRRSFSLSACFFASRLLLRGLRLVRLGVGGDVPHDTFLVSAATSFDTFFGVGGSVLSTPSWCQP